ncbi:Plant UBX domain-containing protein [Forsythia ovata]|uniref:Plant UBX domain-containing protein n=1 Tax=Forsythia ovata TaxID=205694 RepID=A0ABD1X0Z5_9LAMI
MEMSRAAHEVNVPREENLNTQARKLQEMLKVILIYSHAISQRVEGPKSPEEMLTILQRVLEESAPVLVSSRLEAEERRNNLRLREEQDAAYLAALEADEIGCQFLKKAITIRKMAQ